MKKFVYMNQCLIFSFLFSAVMAVVIYLLISFVNVDIDFRNWDIQARISFASFWMIGAVVLVVYCAMSDSMVEMDRKSDWDKRDRK